MQTKLEDLYLQVLAAEQTDDFSINFFMKFHI